MHQNFDTANQRYSGNRMRFLAIQISGILQNAQIQISLGIFEFLKRTSKNSNSHPHNTVLKIQVFFLQKKQLGLVLRHD